MAVAPHGGATLAWPMHFVPDTASPRQRAPARWRGCAFAAAACVLVTLAAAPLSDVLAPANLVMLYLLATVGVALRWGRGAAALAAVLNVLAFDFFYVPPHLSFAVGDMQYLITFAVMLVVGLVTGQLTGGLRRQAQISAMRAQRAQSLSELARELSAALLHAQVAQLGAAAVRRQFGGEAVVLYTDMDHALVVPGSVPAGFALATAQDLVREDADAPPPGPRHAQGWHYLPLQAPARVRGVLALRPEDASELQQPEPRQHLETLARQIAIALERVHYVEVAQQALVEMESERLRNALLAAVSHDVRTPLTVLIGLAEALRRSQPPLAPSQAELAEDLARQARALGHLVGNLLEMARLQSGRAPLRLEWQSVEEVVGAALRSAAPQLAGVPVQVRVPADLPLVEFDAVLMERVLANLLENAAKYGAPPIELQARATPEALEVSVRDHGPGLPALARGRPELLFEKFTRGDAESAQPGVGLGLAICKAVVEAHRGRVAAHDAEGGGALFRFHIPRRPPPPAPT